MRKIITGNEQHNAPSDHGKWLDLEHLARVEVTSEDNSYPIEEALKLNEKTTGWRASGAGKQTIRIIFDEPQQISLIHLYFREDQQERTQEFLLRWSPGPAHAFQEIVRQQFNFSPGATVEEKEEYRLELQHAKVIELIIEPDMQNGKSTASVSRFWLS